MLNRQFLPANHRNWRRSVSTHNHALQELWFEQLP
jgi:hypothetical protein